MFVKSQTKHDSTGATRRRKAKTENAKRIRRTNETQRYSASKKNGGGAKKKRKIGREWIKNESVRLSRVGNETEPCINTGGRKRKSRWPMHVGL